MFNKWKDLIWKEERKFAVPGFAKAREVPFRTAMQMSRAVKRGQTNKQGAKNSPAVRYGDESLFAGELESLSHAYFLTK